MGLRGAVVIGVDKVGDSAMAVLDSATSGADKIGDWLEHKEGYKVERVTDQTEPVTVERVKSKISLFANEARGCDFLLVYFSGHGMEVNGEDHWMLSHAPQDPDAAINLYAASRLAQRSGIANVVFVSDCCRTVPGNPRWNVIGGSQLFPNLGFREVRTKVDVFRAAGVGEPAYEVLFEGQESKKSVLTEALLSAFDEPQPDMVRRVGEKLVVPNRKLEGYLEPKVRQLLRKVDRSLVQTVLCDVPSGDRVYIASTSHLPSAEAEPTLPDLHYAPAPTEVRGKGGALGSLLDETLSYDEPVLQLLAPRPKLAIAAAEQVARDLKAAFLQQLPIELESAVLPMFVVRGTHVSEVCGQLVDQHEIMLIDDEAAACQLVVANSASVESTSSVALLFADGRCALLPVLRDYVAHLTLDDSGLHSVHYAALSSHPNSHEFHSLLSRDTQPLRTYLQQAAIYRDLWPGDPSTTERLVYFCTQLLAFDPSLSLYLSYGLSSACREDMLARVRDRVKSELGGLPLDLALLDLNGESSGSVLTACPLLRKGWNLLALTGEVLAPALARAQGHLCPSQWTLFDSTVGEQIYQAAKQGDL